MRTKACFAAAFGLCWIASTATAEPAPPIERAVLDELNYARQHPREYAAELRDYRNLYDGYVVHRSGDPVGVITREGVAAVDEAIDFLEHQAPLPPLAPGSILALAARDHAFEQGISGVMGHISRDGASPGERVRRHGGDIYVGETISYGPSDGAAVVRSLIVDDGVPGRGHRALIFSTGLYYAGVGCGAHARYGVVCVVDYSGTPNGGPLLPGAMQSASATGSRTVSR